MFEIDEMQSTEGAPMESSPSTPETTANTESSAPQGAEVNNPTNEQSNLPFHEHPRWKEIMQEREQFKSEITRMRQEMEGLRPKPEPAPDPRAKILERLKGIDPEFAGLMEELVKGTSKVSEFEQQMQAERAQAQQQQLATQMTQLHEQHKVPKEMQDLYRQQVRAIAADNPNLKVTDLPNVYRQVHESVSKMLDNIRRAERESYLAGKKQDSNVPVSQPKGHSTKPAPKKQDFSSNPDEARQQVVSRVLQSMRDQRSG